jgi:transposase
MRKVVGLDISRQKTAVCVLDHDGQLVWQGKVDSEPGPLIDKLQLWRDQIDVVGPGVGPITSLAFRVTVDDPERFESSRSVGAHIGLTPRVYQSGETDRSGQISKAGDHILRHLLYEAASALMTRCRQPSKLRAWGVAVARRRGAKRARVAAARKLAVIMHRMWVAGSAFRTGVEKPKLAAA